MKIFISWSGSKSKKLAEAFNKWLPSTIQAVKPYFSPNDIDKGSRWALEIAKELEETDIGLLFLTKDNIKAPWLMFEAGALSKSMENSRVVPLLFELEPTDIKGPLTSFQSSKFEKEEIRSLLVTINNQLDDKGLDTKVLDSVFDKWWPDLNEQIDNILQSHPVDSTHDEIRTDRDILEEILEHSRLIRSRDFLIRSQIETFLPVRDTDPILDQRIEYLDLTVRAVNCLKAENIEYIGQLAQYSEMDLLKIPNLGRKSWSEIKEELYKNRLSLGQDLPDWAIPF